MERDCKQADLYSALLCTPSPEPNSCPLPRPHSALRTPHSSPLTCSHAHRSLFTVHCPLRRPHGSRLTAHMRTAHCLLLTAHMSHLRRCGLAAQKRKRWSSIRL